MGSLVRTSYFPNGRHLEIHSSAVDLSPSDFVYPTELVSLNTKWIDDWRDWGLSLNATGREILCSPAGLKGSILSHRTGDQRSA